MTDSSTSSIIAPESDFTWAVSGGTTIRITGYTGSGGVVYIPDTISGLPVTNLGKDSFKETGVTIVYVPEGVTNLSDGVFYGCSQLETVYLPSSLTTIGAEVFQSSSLEEIEIPNSVVYFGLGDLIDDGNIFKDCTSLVSATIGSGVTDLYASVFENCSSLESLVFLGDAPTYDVSTFSGVNEELLVYYYADNDGWGEDYAGFPLVCMDCSELSSSSQSSISSSSVSSQSSQSSLYGYLAVPSNLRKTSFNPATREFLIQWDWTNPPLANPQEPTGFTIERRIGSRDWSVLSFSIPGDSRSYIDILTSDELRNVLINGEQVGYRIKAYWDDPS